MPSSITHELIAHEALKELPDCAKNAAIQAPDYFYLGAQGPDLFFFYRPLTEKADNLGRYLHRQRIYEWFSAMLAVLPGYTGEDFTKCLAYALGFCSHLAADAVFHPFIYNYLKANEEGRLVHQQIENDWDVYFLREIRGQSVRSYAFPFRLDEIAEDGILYRFLSEAALKIGRELKASAFRRMLRNFSVYLRHFHSSGRRILRYFGLSTFYPRSKPNPLFLRGRKFSEYAEGRGKNADELFLLATTESVLRMQAFLEAFNADMVLPKALFNVHLLTGKGLS